MRRSSALLLFIGAAFCVFAVILGTQGTDDRRELELVDPESSGTAVDAPPASLDAIPAPAPIETRARESTESATTQEALALGPHWNVRAMNELFEVTIPDADVYFFSPQRISEVILIEDPIVFFDMTKFYERYGLHRRTNAAGIAEIPIVEGTFWVVAMSPNLFGGGAFEPKAVKGGQLDLPMRDSEILEVLVLGARNRKPKGGVAVALRDEALMSFPIGAKSDAQGIARIGPCAVRRNNEPARFVTVHGVFKSPIEAWGRPHSEPRPELLVPDSERLLVRIVDARGKVCPVDGELTLEWEGRPKIPAEAPKLSIRSGTVSIPRVELGIKLTLRANPSGSRAQLTKEFTMPEVARDQHVDLEMDASASVVRVKLESADGRSFGPATWNASCALSCGSSGQDSRRNAGKLRGSGTITFAFDSDSESACDTNLVVIVHPLTGQELGGFLHTSTHRGMNELGDLVLRPGSLLCSGRVVDRQGAPVFGSPIELWGGFHGEDVPGMLATATVSGEDGRFELRGWGERPEFRVDGYSGMVKLGQTGVTIVVNPQEFQSFDPNR